MGNALNNELMDDREFEDGFRAALTEALSNPPFLTLFDTGELDREQFINRATLYCLGIARINREINLTAITSPVDMAIKHVVDSGSCFLTGHWAMHARVCDVGTGGGFPGAILVAARPDLKVTFVDSVQKKLKAIEKVASDVGIKADFVHGRAELVGADKKHRENFDVVVARALAGLRVAAELCLPLVAPGGWFIAMKGPDVTKELTEAKRAVRILGGVIDSVSSISLPEGAGDRTLIAIRKVNKTPSKYPRRPGTPRKDPL